MLAVSKHMAKRAHGILLDTSVVIVHLRGRITIVARACETTERIRTEVRKDHEELAPINRSSRIATIILNAAGPDLTSIVTNHAGNRNRLLGILSLRPLRPSVNDFFCHACRVRPRNHGENLHRRPQRSRRVGADQYVESDHDKNPECAQPDLTSIVTTHASNRNRLFGIPSLRPLRSSVKEFFCHDRRPRV